MTKNTRRPWARHQRKSSALPRRGLQGYATRVRLAEAKHLLLASDLSVADVAHAVGYTNVHQFYTVFQRYCALLPAEYRRYYTPAGSDNGAASPVPTPSRAPSSSLQAMRRGP